jgi:hypothetical protein
MVYTEATVNDANFVILTREQFINDYPDAPVPLASDGRRVLVLHDDEDELIVALWGFMPELQSYTEELASYVRGAADPGPVEPKVGPNHTELAR